MNELKYSETFTIFSNDIVDNGDLTPNEIATYVALQRFAGRNNFCYPSRIKLMAKTGIKSTNTQKKALDGLEAKGYIEIKPKLSENGCKCGVDTYFLKYVVAPKNTKDEQQRDENNGVSKIDNGVSKTGDKGTQPTPQNLNAPSQNMSTGVSKFENKEENIKTKYKNINNNSTNTSSANNLNSNTQNDLAETSTTVSQILDTLEFNLGKRFPASAKCGNDRIVDLIDKRIEEGWTAEEVCETINFMVSDFKQSVNDMTPSCNPWSILGRFFNEYATKLRVFKRVSKRRKEEEPKHIPIVNSWEQGNLFECMA